MFGLLPDMGKARANRKPLSLSGHKKLGRYSPRYQRRYQSFAFCACDDIQTGITFNGSTHGWGEPGQAASFVLSPAPKEQFPRNSQVPVPIHVSTLESGTAVSTDGEHLVH
jgi:hypothetical protein